MARPTKSLSTKERFKLARRVLDTAAEECCCWREDALGIDLAYLVGAILSKKQPMRVWWCKDFQIPTLNLTIKRFKKWFSKDDPVWQFIDLSR